MTTKQFIVIGIGALLGMWVPLEYHYILGFTVACISFMEVLR